VTTSSPGNSPETRRMNATATFGVIHGRFQILHNDHMRYLLAGKERCEHLVVGITNPDPTLVREDAADKYRHGSEANPLTYFERYVVLREALREAGLRLDDFSIVPFPINFPELLRYYVPMDAVFFVTIYDDWGRRKLEMLRSEGFVVDVMWERNKVDKGIESSTVRGLMKRDSAWEHLVPFSTAGLMKKWQIPERLKMLNSGRNA
jgi:nicotinamide mononucleotide adenylyltransferase